MLKRLMQITFFLSIDRPASFEDENLEAAFQSLSDEMHSLGVNVYNVDDLKNIETFARFASEDADNFQLTH